MPTPFGAFDAFAGYLLFDALIAHGDRHDRNWAVIVPPPGAQEAEALCPSFDHAASLGFTLTEGARAQHIRDGTVASWANHGYARRFEHRPGTRWQTLVDLAESAIELCRPGTREYWRERISVGRVWFRWGPGRGCTGALRNHTLLHSRARHG